MLDLQAPYVLYNMYFKIKMGPYCKYYSVIWVLFIYLFNNILQVSFLKSH